jgi:hypothetical protein
MLLVAQPNTYLVPLWLEARCEPTACSRRAQGRLREPPGKRLLLWRVSDDGGSAE